MQTRPTVDGLRREQRHGACNRSVTAIVELGNHGTACFIGIAVVHRATGKIGKQGRQPLAGGIAAAAKNGCVIAQGDGERKEKAMLVELGWSLATKPNAEMQLWLEKV